MGIFQTTSSILGNKTVMHAPARKGACPKNASCETDPKQVAAATTMANVFSVLITCGRQDEQENGQGLQYKQVVLALLIVIIVGL